MAPTSTTIAPPALDASRRVARGRAAPERRCASPAPRRGQRSPRCARAPGARPFEAARLRSPTAFCELGAAEPARALSRCGATRSAPARSRSAASRSRSALAIALGVPLPALAASRRSSPPPARRRRPRRRWPTQRSPPVRPRARRAPSPARPAPRRARPARMRARLRRRDSRYAAGSAWPKRRRTPGRRTRSSAGRSVRRSWRGIASRRWARSSSELGIGRRIVMSGATDSSTSTTSASWCHGKAASHAWPSSGAHGLCSRSASARERPPSAISASDGRTNLRPRTPNQRPLSSSRSPSPSSKRSSSKKISPAVTAGWTALAMRSPMMTARLPTRCNERARKDCARLG